MKPAPFSYHAPQDVDELARLMSELEDVKLLAGGQSLMPMMNFRYVTPEHIVDLNRIETLCGIDIQDNRVAIGAMTRQHALLEHERLAALCPLIHLGLTHVGHIATRNRGTVGGSLAHLDPAAELPALMCALDATLRVQGTDGQRDVAIREWALDYMMPDLNEGEWLAAVEFDLPAQPHGYGFHEVARRHGDFALAGAVALLEFNPEQRVTSARVVVFGLDVAPVRLTDAEQMLIGQRVDAQLIDAASACTQAIDVVVEDVHASVEYRQQVSGVMVRRALNDAATVRTPREPGSIR